MLDGYGPEVRRRLNRVPEPFTASGRGLCWLPPALG